MSRKTWIPPSDGRSPSRARLGRWPRARSLALWLAPLATLVLALAQISARADSHLELLSATLPTPLGPVDGSALGWIRGASVRARVFEISVARAPAAPTADLKASPVGARIDPPRRDAEDRVRLRLDSGGTSRLLLLLDGHGDGSRLHALRDWLAGRARLVLAADREWVDIGALPKAGDTTLARAIGLLPGAFGFAEANPAAVAASNELAGSLGVGLRDTRTGSSTVRGPGGAVPSAPILVEVVRPAPVPLGEALARIFFFVTTGHLLLPVLLGATILFIVGWAWLARPGRRPLGAFLLVSSVVLLHATILPPLQAADETSHAGAIETLVAAGLGPGGAGYPRSVAQLAAALEQERVQHHPREALPVAGEAARIRLRAALTRPMRHQIDQPGTPPAGAFVLDSTLRAPAFYQPFRLLSGFARRLSILDRLSLYRLLSTIAALALAAGGLLWLSSCACSESIRLGYCAVLLWPYAVIVMASTSNYGPATGAGVLAAAAAVSAVLAPEEARRRRSRLLLLGTLLFGAAVWPDFSLAAGVVGLAWLGECLTRLVRPMLVGKGRATDFGATDSGDAESLRPAPGKMERTPTISAAHEAPGLRARTALALGATVVALGGSSFWIFRSMAIGNPEGLTRLVRTLRDPESFAYLVTLGPFLMTALLAWHAVRRSPTTPAATLQRARRMSLGLAMAGLFGFLVLPHTTIPYERRLLPPAQLLEAWLRTQLSTAFSFDQDALSWKLLVGSAGWHDVPYPDAMYAVLRWASVVFLIALPILTARARTEQPRAATALLLLSGTALSLASLTVALRHAALIHPHGRFLMPWLPLIVLPQLARVDGEFLGRFLPLLVRAAVLLQLFASLTLVGSRYALGV